MIPESTESPEAYAIRYANALARSPEDADELETERLLRLLMASADPELRDMADYGVIEEAVYRYAEIKRAEMETNFLAI